MPEQPAQQAASDIIGANYEREFYRGAGELHGLSERNYFGVSDLDANAGLVEMNRFWYEVAHHGPGTLLTPACLSADGARSEILLALSLIDLPFAPASALPAQAAIAPVAAAPTLVVRSTIAPLPVRANVLRLEQRLYRRRPGPLDISKATLVGGELVPGTAYCAVIIVLNPSPQDRQVELLAQIPQGSVTLAGCSALLGRSLLVRAFANEQVVLDFYFPAAGSFAQFPAHLSEGEAVVAVADAPAVLKVRPEAAPVGTWDQRSTAEVLTELANADLDNVNLEKLLPRLEERDFFVKATTILQQRRTYDRRVWSYALRHDLPAAITTLLLHEDSLIERLGRALDAPLLHLDPIPDHLVRHLDLTALSNSRSHHFPGLAHAGSGPLDERYAETLGWLCLRTDPGAYGWLELAYQLMLQDRIAEAQAAFTRVDAARLPTRLQYDYFHAWLALHQADAATARTIATPYADYPLESWRLRFAEMIAQLDESEGKPAKREDALARRQRQQLQAAVAPSLHAELGDGQLTVAANQVAACEVRYYPLDLELMFSRAPFALDGLARVAQISPALVEKVASIPPSGCSSCRSRRPSASAPR